jgi:hypothetical protein
MALDFIVKLPISQGFDSILTITDQGCTKAAIFIPCNEDITVAEETAALYIKHVFAHFRTYQRKLLATEIHRFMSKFMQEACKVTGIKHAPSTAYHPKDRQTIGKIKSMAGNGHTISSPIEKQKNWAPVSPNRTIRAQ